jgi:LuxR family maltose regulon positive regulatory protein
MGAAETGLRQGVPLLVTKLNPPLRRGQTVARERLIERLQPAPGIKLTVIAAPAGSGKTTLLGSLRELEQETRPVAWVTLDERDNDPVVLWSYVLAALQSAIPTFEVQASPEGIGSARVVDIVLPELVNELAALGEITLMLDDFHHLSSGAARDGIARLIDHAPSTFRLVLASRSEPGLRIAALRAHAALVELRASDLAFTRGEAEELLNDRLELGLKSAAVDDLVERTEGWPAGLYLAALSLRAIDDREAFLAKFGGESRHVVDFLVDEVLEAHDPALQTLMLRSSILDRLCGSLCDAVLEQDGSARLLETLARTNLFLMPLDDTGQWYRFHHLFRQLLRVELEHREPGLTAMLHRRAYAWHRENESFDEAIDHALKAHAFAEAGDLVGATWLNYVNVGRLETVLAWLVRFPPEVVQADAQLLLVQAWILSIEGWQEGAADAIDALERLAPCQTSPLPDGFSSVEASLATLRGVFSSGDYGTGLEHSLRAAELEPLTSPWRSVVCFAAGICLFFCGRFAEADRSLGDSTECALAGRQWRVAAVSLGYRSLIAGELGRQDDQIVLAEQAEELARAHGLEGADGEVFVARGEALVAQGRFDEALLLFDRATSLARLKRFTADLGLSLLHQAALLQALGRRDEAAPLIDEARAVIDSCPDPRMLAEWLAALERRPVGQGRPVGEGSENGELSERELVVLRMLVGRLTERDIGRELYLSRNTIHSHTKSIYRKLGASSRAEALDHARSLGLI